jgi:hypothetical protein
VALAVYGLFVARSLAASAMIFSICSGSRGKRLLTFFDEESIDRCGVALGHGNGVCPRFEVDLQVN